MFKKLRNRIILINMLTTTIVLFAAFSAIYSIAKMSVEHRDIPKNPDFSQTSTSTNSTNSSTPTNSTNNGNGSNGVYTDSEDARQAEINDYLHTQIEEDRKAALQTLLSSLIITGVAVEFIVYLISLYLAEQSIRPVRETYEAQKQFIANASHEIKTPLAVIQANLEAADIKGNEWIDNVAIKTEELANLNNQLLTLARVESNTNTEDEKKEIVLSSYISDLVKPLTPQLKKKKITLKIDKKNLKHEKYTISEIAFRQIINILLDNAIKYCDKKITVILDDKKITVKNDGTTIEKDKLAHLFERFYQVDKTKNGVGLGLAIASQVAEKNSWKITADSDEKSTSFMLEF